MATQDFRVTVSGGVVTLDAWRKAMEAEENQLPRLDDAQREAAQIVGMTEQEYARGILADSLGRKHQEEIGKRLGRILSDALDNLRGGWELGSLLRKGANGVWIAHFISAGDAGDLEIPIEIADDVVESGDLMSRGRLERLLSNRLEMPARRAAS